MRGGNRGKTLLVGLFLVFGPTLFADGYYVSAETPGPRPVFLTGQLDDDFRRLALDATVAVGDELPKPNVLQSWKLLGVKMLRRAAWDPEGSAEFFRRQAGFLPFFEHADGVWLEGEKSFPDTWRRALAEAKTDLAVARYLDGLAEEALGSGDHRLRLEGRRVKWLFDQLDFEGTDLDCLRLEFVAYAKFLEDVLGKPPKDLPTKPAEPIVPDVLPFTPCAGRDLPRIEMAPGARVELVPGLAVEPMPLGGGLAFVLSSSVKSADKGWPGGRYRLKLYLPDEGGTFLPYEFLIDLTDVPEERAPAVGYGLFSVTERFGWGKFFSSWRCRPVLHRSPSAAFLPVNYRFNGLPINPTVKFERAADGTWTAKVGIDWLAIYGHWPMVKNGVRDQWYVTIDRLPDRPDGAAVKLVWPRGADRNFATFANGIDYSALRSRYQAALHETRDMYRRGEAEGLYPCVRAKKPAFQRFGADDAMFLERCVEPLVERTKDVARMTSNVPNGFELQMRNEPLPVKMMIWKAIRKMLTLSYDVSRARRDYLALRFAGGEPPPVTKESEAPAKAAPDVSADDASIELDDKEF